MTVLSVGIVEDIDSCPCDIIDVLVRILCE